MQQFTEELPSTLELCSPGRQNCEVGKAIALKFREISIYSFG
jgi:hypothetical protein